MPVNADFIRNWTFEPVYETYDEPRTILYALGVGAGAADSDLDLVYEKRLKALPTIAAVLAPDPMWMLDPRAGITMTHVLHGEQGLQIHKPLPAAGTIRAQTFIDGLFDKGEKGAVLRMRRELRDDATDELLATTTSSAFMRADGGFGGVAEGQPAPHAIPDRLPDATISLLTRDDQALIYRLSGDYNPLHIDPEIARAAGFPRPILHGLGSYGIAGRAIIAMLCEGDPHRLTRFDVRFSSPVFPGETLLTEVWHDGPGKAAFRAKVAERGVVALNNGRAEFSRTLMQQMSGSE
jgi:acyl dehydratase